MSAEIKDNKNTLSKSDRILRVFGVIDIIALALAIPVILPILLIGIGGLLAFGPFGAIVIILRVLLSFSYAVSANAYFTRKRWVFPLYYCQFSLRMLFFAVVVGMIYAMNESFRSSVIFWVIVGMVLFAELTRLVITTMIQRGPKENFWANLCSFGPMGDFWNNKILFLIISLLALAMALFPYQAALADRYAGNPAGFLKGWIPELAVIVFSIFGGLRVRNRRYKVIILGVSSLAIIASLIWAYIGVLGVSLY